MEEIPSIKSTPPLDVKMDRLSITLGLGLLVAIIQASKMSMH